MRAYILFIILPAFLISCDNSKLELEILLNGIIQLENKQHSVYIFHGMSCNSCNERIVKFVNNKITQPESLSRILCLGLEI